MLYAETDLIVRYAETDQMGIVHHSNYPIWFEAGRTDFIKKLGMSYSSLEKAGVMLPLIELRCSYKGAARYEDKITVKTYIKEYTGARISFIYEVYKNDEAGIITTGETLHVWTDNSLKPVILKQFLPEIHEMIMKALNDG